jgi:hypothetical protein
MPSSKLVTIPTMNTKTGKMDKYQATTWSVPGTPFIVNVTPGYENDEKRRYTITHKHTGWGILLCGAVTRKSAIEAARALFDNYPSPLKVAMNNTVFTPHELQDKIKTILDKRTNKTTWNQARIVALFCLKQS